jgi:hypothetical protein
LVAKFLRQELQKELVAVLRMMGRQLQLSFRSLRSAWGGRVDQPHGINPSTVARPSCLPGQQCPSYPPDFSQRDIAIIEAVAPYTMTSPERILALVLAVEYVVNSRIKGDIVECGVWKGGSIMAAALALMRLGDRSRTLHLFDTFDGMPAPAEIDRDCRGSLAAEQLAEQDRETSAVWAFAQLDEVQRNLAATHYPCDRLRFVRGLVEETVPHHAPERIALLRLDTDWYESTWHELVHLYPRLAPGGVLIIDDYGHWQGARRATDQFLASLPHPPLLCRIDYTGRIAIKPALAEAQHTHMPSQLPLQTRASAA